MEILTLSCLSDNYSYLIVDRLSGCSLVVDPSESEPVVEAVKRSGSRLIGILATHHHLDHVGGIRRLIEHFGSIPVFAHSYDRERTPGVSSTVEDNQEIEIAGFRLRAMHVPGHTLGAVAWLMNEAVFTGDTLFAAGCGRVFEGTAPMMWQSLNRLKGLPDGTNVYFGHEYTLANLRFAAHVEPENQQVQERMSWVRARLDEGQGSVPSTIAQEKASNPFLRCGEPSLGKWAARFGLGPLDEAGVFELLRRHKNDFKD